MQPCNYETMKPLSVLTYYTRNKLKLAPVFAVLALAVFGISLTGVLTGTIRDSALQRIEVYRSAVQVSPSFLNGRNTIDASLKADLQYNPSVEALVPDIRLSTYLPTLSGQMGAHIYAVNVEVYPLLMKRFDLELIEGRLPRAGAPEVALHEVLARARGLNIGDVLDPEKDNQEWLRGRLEIVGLLRGPTVLSLASLEYVERRSEFRGYARSLLAIPQLEAQAVLENDLRGVPKEEARVYTYSSELQIFAQDFASMDAIVWAINSVVVLVLSLLVGLLNMIYFLDRMNEFGLLLGIGYARGFLIRRALIESLLLTVLAWAFGIVFAQVAYGLLNQFIFEPRGMSLSVLNWRALQFTLPIPIMVGLFTAGTVIWQLRKLDPISIIERRD